MQSEADVDAYVRTYLYQRLRNAFPLPGFTSHSIKAQAGVFGMVGGQPDFVATAWNSAGQERVLFVAESKTKESFSVPDGTTTTAAWQHPDLRAGIVDAVDQVFGYMKNDGLRYSLLTTGEMFVFMQRDGNTLMVADVQRTSSRPTPMQGILHLMQRWVMPTYALPSQCRSTKAAHACDLVKFTSDSQGSFD